MVRTVRGSLLASGTSSSPEADLPRDEHHRGDRSRHDCSGDGDQNRARAMPGSQTRPMVCHQARTEGDMLAGLNLGPRRYIMIRESQLRGYLLEEALAWLLRNTGYRLLVDESQDPTDLVGRGGALHVKGRGAEHQVDVLGEFVFTPAFSLLIRLFLEAKFTVDKTDLPVVRNAHGVIHDINENFVHGPGQRLRRRYRYVYTLFSAKGFTKAAQDFALAQQISLVDLSGASLTWLRESIATAAAEIHDGLVRFRVERSPVGWMRGRLRQMLDTMPVLPAESVSYPETGAHLFADAAGPVLNTLARTLTERERSELLLGFPSAPFVLTLAIGDVERFLAYASTQPDHQVRVRRTGTGSAAEWIVTPAVQVQNDLLFKDEREGYELTFNLPDELESWISQDEQYRVSRTRAVKKQFLSDIVIYRMEGDNLQTFQLKYEPSVLHGRREQR
jgi:hypothetical protein